MNLHTTDACPNSVIQNVEHQLLPIMDVRVLEQIQPELEECEKVGIVFLLAAEYPAAYTKVIDLCRNIKDRPDIISEYMQNYSVDMREKLIEALCIIGNHEILQNLGFANTSELSDNKYHAGIPRYTVKVHAAVKVLYKLFESLDGKKTQQLLQSIYNEGQVVRQLNTHYLELHALHWLQEGYITISLDGTANLSNLLKHLKRLDLYSETIYHDVEYFSPSSGVLDVIDSCTQGTQVLPNKGPETSARNDVPMNAPNVPAYTIKKGLCVIINEVDYETDQIPFMYPNRDGSNMDRDKLVKTFKRRNFDIETAENLSRRAVKQQLKEISDNFDVTNHDCLVVCILSHGYEGGIVTCDGLEISNKAIEDQICTDKLRDVIKLLIVQACQGKHLGDVSGKSELATDGPREWNLLIDDIPVPDLATDGPSQNLLRYKNFCEFMSTMNHFVSIRHKKLGSWFIEAVCEELARSDESISFPHWELLVKANVQRREGFVDGCKTSQLPEFRSRLKTLVYFPPCVDNPAR